MIDTSKIDYSSLDRPEILMFLFYPRAEWGISGEKTMLIPVEKGVVVGARFHTTNLSAPNILFFHGNGEIAADYDELALMYNHLGINFLPVDYRGYGRSTGQPTVTAMMRDCHVIFEFVKQWLKENNFTGSFIVMGRSLGSASALELAANYKPRIDALIIESGFAHAGPLLQRLGVDTEAPGFDKVEGLSNTVKIGTFDKPTLVIHAEEDHIIPFSDGRELYEACPSDDKVLLQIPEANHNDIFQRGLSEYMAAVQSLADKTR
jgi:pimeloyl-ACP methyl ester carboxylesterase